MRLLSLAAGRRAKVLVALVAVLLAAGLATRAGGGETTDDPAALLPAGAESVAALRAVERIRPQDAVPAVTVLFREGGLTREDRAAVRRLAGDLAARPVPGTGATGPPQVSRTGEAALLVTPVTAADEELAEAVEALRERVGAGERGGLQVAVTGGAGFAADVVAAFEGVDGALLLGAAALVLVLLVLIYRSPVFWLVPFLVVVLTEAASRGAQALLVDAGATITPAGSGIAVVLTFGAATDYALLLVARYREELRRHEDVHEAMRRALLAAGPSIVASGLTVVAALLVLLLADLGDTRALGPVAATGVLLAMVLALTLLPAALVLVGRRAFWPAIPRVGQAVDDPRRGPWGRLGARVGRRPRAVWVGGTVVLLVLAAGVTRVDLGLGEGQTFTGDSEAADGQVLLTRGGFPAGSSATLDVVVPDRARAPGVAAALRAREGLVAAVGEPQVGGGAALLPVSLTVDPFDADALDRVPELREAARAAGGPGVLVGGDLAEDLDVREAAERDNAVVPPVVLALVLLILVVLLRALVLPLLLLASVIVSFAAALGAGVVLTDLAFGFERQDPTLPLIAFIFLVALGVDYNVFLVARAREEAARHGTREGMLRALAATGGVITSAGIVLAGTFSILGVLPVVTLIQLAVIIGLGVLLDTFLVRAVLVPALVFDVGPKVWWPSRLGRARADAPPPVAAMGAADLAGPAPQHHRA